MQVTLRTGTRDVARTRPLATSASLRSTLDVLPPSSDAGPSHEPAAAGSRLPPHLIASSEHIGSCSCPCSCSWWSYTAPDYSLLHKTHLRGRTFRPCPARTGPPGPTESAPLLVQPELHPAMSPQIRTG